MLARRFPYDIYYEIEDEIAYIVAVFRLALNRYGCDSEPG